MFFSLFRQPDIHAGVEAYRATENALLLDVRTPGEYQSGHIPGSRNLPLQHIEGAVSQIQDPATPIFVYCQSGARSRQASAILQQLGFENVTNIGGIAAYRGKVELS